MTIAGAIYREGVAYSPDGAMYVSLPSGSTVPAPSLTGLVNIGGSSDLYLTRYAAKQIMVSGDGTGAAGTSMGMVIGTASNNIAGLWSGGLAATFNSANACLFVDNSGNSNLNAPTGATAGISINGTSKMTVNAANVSFPSAQAATSRTDFQKATTAIANAVATTVATLTIPNAAHSAAYEVMVVGSLGAGGAIGANEASAINVYTVVVTRTAGVAAVAAISLAYGAAASAVAGAATVTSTLTLAAMSGAVGATNTCDLQVTISRSGGSSANHTAQVFIRLINANASGVSIA